MTYLDYINQFWQTQANVQFSSNEVYLYFYLLKECNSQGWENPFECPNRRILLSISISEPTLIDCRNRLQQKGLIEFQAGKRREKSPIYYLKDLSKDFSKDLSKSFSKDLSKSLSSYKEYRIKNNNNSDELFPPEKEKAKKGRSKKSEFIPPTLDDVKNYFEGKLPDWEKQAEIFFYHFDALNWKNTNGARIERWDSRANLWIIEKQLQNGNKSTTNNNGGIVSIATGGEAAAADPNTVTGSRELDEFINSLPIG